MRISKGTQSIRWREVTSSSLDGDIVSEAFRSGAAVEFLGIEFDE